MTHQTLFALAFVLAVAQLATGCHGGGAAPQDDAGPADSVTQATCENREPEPLFSDTGRYTRELYVDRARGSDDGDGSRAQPWRTLQRAGRERRAGDRVHITAGTYFECLRIQGVRGTAEHPVAFVGEGDVRIQCTEGEAVSGSGISYLTVEGLRVQASAQGLNAIHFDGDSDHIVVRRNRVEGVGENGDCIKINQSTDVWVLDNDVHNADQLAGSAQGIDLVGVQRAVIRGNHVHDIADSQGVFVKGGSSDVVIERNRVERLASTRATAIGIVLGGVTDRQFFSPRAAGSEASRVIARNNIVVGADGAGIGAQGCHDCLIANNTLWNTGRRGYAIQMGQGATGSDFAGGATSVNVNVRVVNNLVGNPYGTMRAPIQAEEPHRQGLVLQHNLWWNGERDDVFDPGYNALVGVTGPGSMVDVDPRVLNPDAEAARLEFSGTSPARRAGVALAEVHDDYAGNCRVAPPDLGARAMP